jgi:3-dehydroquinate synthase
MPDLITHAPSSATVSVALAGRSYPIIIGPDLLADAGYYLRRLDGSDRWQRAEIITDAIVAPIYAATVADALRRADLAVGDPIIIPAGEAAKSHAEWARVMDDLLRRKIDRQTLVVALGGGVVGDLAGFVAASALRGLDFIQIPTTLLAQVDSSVGGKTGINSRHGKNLIGAFHQPRLVLADTNSLNTLPHREIRAGYAEIVKYGLINDPDFFNWLCQHGQSVIDGDATARRHAVTQSCQHKAAIVAHDEHETGDRALLNLGHSFGHALEAEAGYDGRLLHGEAVAMGMVMVFDLSVRLGLCPADDAARMRNHLAAMGLPVRLDSTWATGDVEGYLHHMMGDKKNQHGSLTLILTSGIGNAFVAKKSDVGPVRHIWRDYLKIMTDNII